MKPTPPSTSDSPTLLIFGAHPDDIEFGCGGVVAKEAAMGRWSHFVVCSRGEAGTHGTPEQREKEAQSAAAVLGASLEFITLDGDAHLQISTEHALTLAAIIRRIRPDVVLAPSTVPNQHPDHRRLGELVRDACRLARFGGLTELRADEPHSVGQLFFYAVTPTSEPSHLGVILVDISEAAIIARWSASMEAHASQIGARNYVELQLTRARLHGLQAGVEYAVPLFPNDPLIVESLAAVTRSARRF